MILLGALTFLIGGNVSLSSADEGLAQQLAKLDTGVIVVGKVRQPPLASMLERYEAARLRQANVDDRQPWEAVKTLAEWQKFRDSRVKALAASLGAFSPAPRTINVKNTKTLEGDGYRVDCLVVETRPGLFMAANLYRPAKESTSMPGVIICLSHQQPKNVGWRQDMGMTWARAGCVVLVPDHLGHGERRQHPFLESQPHDYHFRFDNAIQLYLAGESLIGWFAWDLMRGVDVLLAQKGVDPRRIVMVSEPAGGGDLAAVTAALDPRIAGVMVNNFGGPQPETPYPLPPDAERSFNYTGNGSWESTRNLRLSARDGFLHWTILAAIAPRKLVYYHEFYWDRDNDPVWRRLDKVWGLYGARDSLTGLAGRGFVVGSAPENTHWLPINREILYPTLERWFKIPSPGKEYSKGRPPEELLCLTPALAKEMKPLRTLLKELAIARGEAARKERAKLSPAERRVRLRKDWANLLGHVESAKVAVREWPSPPELLGKVRVERLHLATEPGIVLPTLLLVPPSKQKQPSIVVALAQEGKHAFLRQRAAEMAELLEAGVAVCLSDLRGCGETSPGEPRGRSSAATSIAATELMLGRTLLGGRLRDLRSLLAYLRTRSDLDARKVSLWGESFAAANPADRNLHVPYTANQRPQLCEPLGGLLSLLGALFEDDVQAVQVRGGLSDYQSLLDSSFCYVPFDCVVPGALTIGDLPDLAATLAPRPLHLATMVNGVNRRISPADLARIYSATVQAYRGTAHLALDPQGERLSAAAFFLRALRR